MTTENEVSLPMKVVIGLGVFIMSVFWFGVRTFGILMALALIATPTFNFISSHFNISMSLDLQKHIFFVIVFVISLILHIVGGIFKDNYKVYQIKAGIIEGTLYSDPEYDGPMATKALADGDYITHAMYTGKGI